MRLVAVGSAWGGPESSEAEQKLERAIEALTELAACSPPNAGGRMMCERIKMALVRAYEDLNIYRPPV